MSSQETRVGKTPNGGVASRASYLNKRGELTDKSLAKEVKIDELDKDGNIIMTTYGKINRK